MTGRNRLLKVTIEGRGNSGKSKLAQLLAVFMTEHGYLVDAEAPPAKNLHDAIRELGPMTVVTIQEKYPEKNYA